MTIGSGTIYGFGLVSGLLLAGLAFLIYLALRDQPDTTDPELEAATARAGMIAARLRAGVDKVETETNTVAGSARAVAGIEPGE